MGERVRFTAHYDGPHGKCDDPTSHFHMDDWQRWFDSLTLLQRQALRNKANWERMSLAAVAMEWGAPASETGRVEGP